VAKSRKKLRGWVDGRAPDSIDTDFVESPRNWCAKRTWMVRS